MADAVEEMRARLRSSLDPVSALYLVDSPAVLARMLATAAALGPFGVTPDQLTAIRDAVAAWLRPSPADAPRRIWLEFQAEGQTRPGCVEFTVFPGQGVEVQVVLPGVVAATAPGFLAGGFWCAFMPPSFYSPLP